MHGEVHFSFHFSFHFSIHFSVHFSVLLARVHSAPRTNPGVLCVRRRMVLLARVPAQRLEGPQGPLRARRSNGGQLNLTNGPQELKMPKRGVKMALISATEKGQGTALGTAFGLFSTRSASSKLAIYSGEIQTFPF